MDDTRLLGSRQTLLNGDRTRAIFETICAAGGRVLDVHTSAGGICSCRKGRGCTSPGKHPRRKNWKAEATSDLKTILGWLDQKLNVGLSLEPPFFCDVENDSAEGELLLRQLGIDQCRTWTYKSKRSTHRLFLSGRDLPDVQKIVVGGVEIRIGGDKKQTMSVIPPSLHFSGEKYAWVEGLSPLDVPLLQCPEQIITLAWNPEPAGEPVPIDVRARGYMETLPRGLREREGRNNTAFIFAAFMRRDLGQSAEVARRFVDEWNSGNVDPLSSDEVAEIIDHAAKYGRSEIGSGLNGHTPTVESTPAPATVESTPPSAPDATAIGKTITDFFGLKRDSKGRWAPGDWRSAVVNADPFYYVILVPGWPEIPVPFDCWDDPKKVAKCIRAVMKTVVVDREPRFWTELWNGRRGRCVALKAQLLSGGFCKVRDAPSVQKRFVIVASILHDKLASATKAGDPDPMGRPVELSNGSYWFKWEKVWQDALMQGLVKQSEIDDLIARLGLERRDFNRQAKAKPDTPRPRCAVLTRTHWLKLKEIVRDGGECSPNEEHTHSRPI